MTAPHVISAAAGSGKTTRLVAIYLRHLRDGLAPRDIIAITFTRAAGAELIERVALALRASLGDDEARAELGGAWHDAYADAVPRDPEVALRALRGLPSAPIGTTDSFVISLLSEFALQASLPLPGGGEAPLDLPVAPGDPTPSWEQAARAVLDPHDAPVLPEVARCLAHLTLSELVERVIALGRPEPLPPVWARDLFPVALGYAAQVGRTSGKIGTTSGKVKEAQDATRVWQDGGCLEGAEPSGLVPWVNFFLDADSKDAEQVKDLVAQLPPWDAGVCRVAAKDVLRAFASFWTPEAIDAADQLRADLLSLADRVRGEALRRCAAQRELDHGLLTEAAIHLCQRPPERLRRRFRALLVDEAQDVNPQQLRLYAALSALPGGGEALATTWVGDPRQSIYLFRGAEPSLFVGMYEASEAAGRLERLDTNRRSSPTLVAAHHALFDPAVLGGGEGKPLTGVISLDGVGSLPGNAALELGPEASGRSAVTLVQLDDTVVSRKSWEYDAAALDAFAEHLGRVWASQASRGRPESAAVLCPTWSLATTARDRLRRLLGHDLVFLDGSRELLKARAASDVRTLLRALWDPSDRLSWAAVWKLPVVGLTDAGLALLHQGRGVRWPSSGGEEERAFGGLSGPMYADGLDPEVHRASDVAAFADAAPVLRAAAGAIGRRPTADVLDEVATDLRWRAAWGAGPDGDDAIGQFEVLLDWIRQTEADAVDPERVLTLLDPENGEELPKVTMTRAARAVSCTTVFQSKGLAWDHVCVLRPGGESSGGAKAAWASQEMRVNGEPRGAWGVCLDPRGALTPVSDPLGVLAEAIRAARAREEQLRCAYVAVTRARRAVFVALFAGCKRGIVGPLSQRWATAVGREGVGVEVRAELTSLPDAAPADVVAVGAFLTSRAAPPSWRLLSPSSAADAWRPEEQRERAAKAIQGVRVIAQGSVIPRPAAVDALDPRDQGDLVHDWMAVGGLRGEGAAALAGPWLAQHRPTLATPEVEAWLVTLAVELAARQPELHAQLNAPDATLGFEVPLVGVDDEGGERLLYQGHIDLLVQWPDGSLWILDFKGKTSPPDDAALLSRGEHREQVLQVDAYRRSLERAGHTVTRCGLLYAGTWTWASWTP
jgi:ATP-dependent exoDNAse (exonuclease V) beta subunit